MPPTSAAMELKVLISIMQSGQALTTMLNQVNQLSGALSKLQAQAAAGGTGGPILPTLPQVPPGGGMGAIPPAAKDAERAVISLDKAMQSVVRTVKFLTGGFLALQKRTVCEGTGRRCRSCGGVTDHAPRGRG